MNTSVALATLGEPAYFLGRMGNDAFAAQLREHLRSHGVNLELTVDVAQPTSLAVVSLDDEGKAQYTFHFDNTSNFGWQADEFPELGEDDWLHFGSIGSVVAPGASAIRDFAATTSARLSFDVNVRPAVQPDMEAYGSTVLDLIEVVGARGGVVKASDEDISQLIEGDGDVLEVARRWVEQYGLSLFVMTLGPDGAAAVLPGGEVVRVPGHTVEVADTVGAGDTFMAGFLSRYVANPSDVEGALRAGAGAAALVCTKQGANPPSSDELAALFARG